MILYKAKWQKTGRGMQYAEGGFERAFSTNSKYLLNLDEL
jgi:hypothetical protein